MTAKRATARLALAAAGLVLAGVACDLGVAMLGLDWRAIQDVLYTNRADADVYEVSEDPVLHYRMRPGAQRPKGPAPDSYGVRVNAWGARGHEHAWDKPEGTFRILHFGGSTVFGALVDDDQTLSARLEQTLSARAGRPVEVWNFGHSAYVQSQMARLAQLELARVPDVDMVMLTITNAKLRAFLDPAEVGIERYAPFFDDDPWLWLETFPDLPLAGVLGDPLATKLHRQGLRHSAIYRLARARHQASRPRDTRSPSASELCKVELLALEARAAQAGVTLVYANHPDFQGAPEPEATGHVIELADPERGASWKEIHPSPAILQGWAEVLADGLLAQALVPSAGGEQDPDAVAPQVGGDGS